MVQLNFFDRPTPAVEPRKLARRNGPETSKQAAEEIAERLNGIQTWALSCVEDCPNCTATEICQELGIGDIRKLNRRLSELETMGLIVRSASPRACRITGKAAATWTAKTKKGSKP